MTTRRHAVFTELRGEIERGSLVPGDQLPTEHALVQRFGISRPTVRAALHMLAERGLIHSVHGHGWYVRDDHVLRYPLLTIDQGHRTADLDAWRRWMAELGRQGDAILTVTDEPPPENVARALRLQDGEHAIARRRIRRVDGTPWMTSTGYYPAWIVKGTPIAGHADMQSPSPLRWLAENGRGIVRDEDEISSRMPTAEEADQLGMGRGVPVMLVQRTSWDLRGDAVRCTVDVMPAHRFRLVVDHRHGGAP